MLFFKAVMCTQFMVLKEAPQDALIEEDQICNEGHCYPSVFEPEQEFKAVLPGQKVPVGLHVQMDFETGQVMAKQIETVKIHTVPQDTSLTMQEKASLEELIIGLNNGNATQKQQLLEHVQDLVFDIDIGLAIAKSDMTDALFMMLESEFAETTARILSAMTSNNPEAQNALLDKEAIPIIWKALLSHGHPGFLSPLSNLVRSNERGMRQFLDLQPSAQLLKWTGDPLKRKRVLRLVQDILDPTFRSNTIEVDWAWDEWCQTVGNVLQVCHKDEL
ncbi:hypothetical protein EDD86DRAFT_196896 [Gorgonomyces haynaldii]|nr:hypothetical protein EDD86DRAFT_196896 [Gorgonomyces haynaldii]